jgi:hypothetical protein
MVKENNLKHVGPTVNDISKKAGGASTTLSSIVVSVVVLISISVIGLSFAYIASNPGYLNTVRECTGKVFGFEQKGYYNNMEQFNAALESCSS